MILIIIFTPIILFSISLYSLYSKKILKIENRKHRIVQIDYKDDSSFFYIQQKNLFFNKWHNAVKVTYSDFDYTDYEALRFKTYIKAEEYLEKKIRKYYDLKNSNSIKKITILATTQKIIINEN